MLPAQKIQRLKAQKMELIGLTDRYEEEIAELVECLTWALDNIPYDSASDTPSSKAIQHCEDVLAKHGE